MCYILAACIDPKTMTTCQTQSTPRYAPRAHSDQQLADSGCVQQADRDLHQPRRTRLAHTSVMHVLVCTLQHASLVPDLIPEPMDGGRKSICCAHVTQCGRVSSAFSPLEKPLIICDSLHPFVLNAFGAHRVRRVIFFFFRQPTIVC